MKRNVIRVPFGLAAALFLALAGTAHASGKHAGGHGPDIGEAGKAANADRTVHVRMVDTAFEPETIHVEAGETVRFVVRNDGELVHEFNIGTPAMHRSHQKEMAEMMNAGVLGADTIDMKKMKSGGMMHDDPNSVLLVPGQTGEIVWKFTGARDLEPACNVPGHYEAGMRGRIFVSN